METNEFMNTTVADMVSHNIKSAHIFKKYGIDFCCGGGKPIAAACADTGVSYDELIAELNQLDTEVDKAHDYQSWTLDYLILHIENIHHTYVRESLPMMVQYAEKVARVHGAHYTELIQVKDLVEELATDLMSHMLKEEQVLFPMIRRVLLTQANSREPNTSSASIQSPIRVMMSEHDRAGAILRNIAELTQGYEPPEGACNTFRAFYAKLEEFEQDLHLHVHLENNILFPKSLALLN
jgi:regulator of cell morphogenesis and NO signaling